MVDIVVNHFAYYGSPSSIDYSTFVPFNSADDFHSYCTIDYNNIANIVSCEIVPSNFATFMLTFRVSRRLRLNSAGWATRQCLCQT